MNPIEKIKQSLADGGYAVFVEEPKAYDGSPQVNVSLFGMRDDGAALQACAGPGAGLDAE